MTAAPTAAVSDRHKPARPPVRTRPEQVEAELRVFGELATEVDSHLDLEETPRSILNATAVSPRPPGLPLGAHGGVVTDAGMRTEVAGVWAAGDCCETQMLKVCDLEVARAGLSMREADAAGLDAVGTVITHKSRASYYPGWQPIRVKLVAERGTGRLLGDQLTGREASPSESTCSPPRSTPVRRLATLRSSTSATHPPSRPCRICLSSPVRPSRPCDEQPGATPGRPCDQLVGVNPFAFSRPRGTGKRCPWRQESR